MEIKDKHKRIIFYIFLLFICVAGAGAVYKFYLKPQIPTSPQQNGNVPQAGTSNSETSTIFISDPQEAFNVCQNSDYDQTPGYGSDAIDTFYAIADIISSGDEKRCSQLGSDTARDTCLNNYYNFLTIMDGSHDYLSNLSGSNKIISEAYVNNDMSSCDSLEDLLLKKTCKVMISLDESHCDFNEDPEADRIARPTCSNSLHFVKALKEKNQEECLKIEDIRSGAVAIEQNSTDKPKGLEKGEKTDNISGRILRLFCSSFISSNPKEEINKQYRNDACYEKYAPDLAKLKNDPSLCEKIPLKDTYNNLRYNNCVKQF